MQKTKIEWVKNEDGSQGYSWNPVLGCKHGCFYCYAKRMNDRFKWIKKWDEPKVFYEERIYYQKMPKKPSKIFVCSMADLFGDWIKSSVIETIIQITKAYPMHTFYFLTKNPKRYSEFQFPHNCWLGFTINGVDTYEENQKILEMIYLKNYRFVSIEPLLDEIDSCLDTFDLVIIGAMTGPNAIKPKKEWIDRIAHPNIFYKNNIRKYL